MTKLLEKDASFKFDQECLKSFQLLKEVLISAPIIKSPYWSLPFELMCNPSELGVGVVLGQRHNKKFHPIYYASKMITLAQENYTTTDKELLAIIYVFNRFCPYPVLAKVVVYTNHATLRYLL